MMDWLRSEFGSLGLVIIATLVATVLGFVMRDWAARSARQQRWSRARVAESAAPQLLRQCGYDVLGAQVAGEYTLAVDGQTVTIALRADFIVARRGRQYVAEVKSGRAAPLLTTAATRRQLLEYLIAFPVQGVLLVDGESREVHEVQFPTPWAEPRRGCGPLSVVAGVVIALIAAVVFGIARR